MIYSVFMTKQYKMDYYCQSNTCKFDKIMTLQNLVRAKKERKKKKKKKKIENWSSKCLLNLICKV